MTDLDHHADVLAAHPVAASDLIPVPYDARWECPEESALNHAIARCMAGQPIPHYVVGPRAFVGVARRTKAKIERVDDRAFIRLDFGSCEVAIFAGPTTMQNDVLELEELP